MGIVYILKRFLYSLLRLYSILILIFVVVFYLYSINWQVFIIIMNIIIWFGILLDSRFVYWRKFLIIILNIIQIVIWYYLELVPILLIKDLFWFSVILNIGFIWHVLILNWLFLFIKKYQYKKGMYWISMFSLCTSLSLIRLLLCECLLIVNLSYYYTAGVISHFNKGQKKIQDFLSVDLIFHILRFIILGLLKINNYFMKSFGYYSLLILGKNPNIDYKSKEFIKAILIFLLMLLLSIYLQYPRIYLVWIFYVIYEFLKLYWEAISELKFFLTHRDFIFSDEYLPFSFIRYFFMYIDSKWFSSVNNFKFVDQWKLIYCSGMYLDYLFFIDQPDWGVFFSPGLDHIKCNVYDVFDLFDYKDNLRVYIYGKIIHRLGDIGVVHDVVFEEFIDTYELEISLEEFRLFLYPDIKNWEKLEGVLKFDVFSKGGLVEYKFFSPEQENNSLYEFLFGFPKGDYIMRHYYD